MPVDIRATLLSVPALVVLAGAVEALPRDALWLVVRSCVGAERLVGSPFPCVRVSPGSAAGPGTALVRPPGARSHLLVVPTTPVSGIEDPVLQGEPGLAYWRAALEARPLVVAALKGRLPLNDVAMAVNSKGGRSQDQLHIHLDCVDPSVRAALDAHARAIGATWTRLPFGLKGGRYDGLRVDAAKARDFNPFAALSRLPPVRGGLRATSLAVVATAADDPRPGFIVLARQAPRAHAEALLDHGCEIASPVAAR
ncbi:CDP-diacylglycerol diphosphatase [Methylobacterium sp.]|uniref:CDP-diacylglycerol diphosphatase n=1 Tax=Methylobacterium sp. TaxID=409 RepID=UPI00258B3928|nr:CDP-diacylglycerol diphosphatase [Methylobacterium sp.]